MGGKRGEHLYLMLGRPCTKVAGVLGVMYPMERVVTRGSIRWHQRLRINSGPGRRHIPPQLTPADPPLTPSEPPPVAAFRERQDEGMKQSPRQTTRGIQYLIAYSP